MIHTEKKIKHATNGFDQLLLFSISNEVLNKQGKWSIYTIDRTVRIYYVGMIDSLHKYQLGCIHSTFELKNRVDSSADLFNKLHSVFRLLVIGADGLGAIKKIYNFPYLQQEWAELKNNLLLEYDDTDIEKWDLICKMDVQMQDYDAVLKYIHLPSMYGLFFNGYWSELLPEKSVNVTVAYDEALNNEVFEECLEYEIQETEMQQLLKIEIKGKSNTENNKVLAYTGTCTYLDGALDQCTKQINIDSTALNYSVRWVGLKKLFQL